MTFAVIAGTIAIVVVTVALGVLVDRRVGVLPRPEDLARANPRVPVTRRGSAPLAGDTAATAIRAHGDQLANLRASQKCPLCKTSLAPTGADERVRYGGAELLLLHFSCPSCQRVRALYVDDRG